MELRKLKLHDAPKMLEWMHDKNVVQDLRTNFMKKNITDCENFIEKSWNDTESLHLAITDENDIYMGTVSLKNIGNKSAEFGITVRSCAMGKGYSQKAMSEILKIAFDNLKLEMVYWCVSPENRRAVRFYDKNEFLHVQPEKIGVIEGYSQEEIKTFVWYSVARSEWLS